MTNLTKVLAWLIIPMIMILLGGCNRQDSTFPPEGEIEMTIQLTSSAFKDGDMLPRMYTCDDKNVSPPLAWSGIPNGTVGLAIIMDDPDAPSGTFVHWVLYNLSPELTSLDQGMTGKGLDGKNDFNRLGYGGPCPPRGSTHRYFIKLYALDILLDLKTGASKSQVESLMRGHILAQGQLMGKYGR
jgi:Raf kinase inhibitor-like YbhB/YbcL family protein